MAVTREDNATKITLQVNTGTELNPVYKERNFNNVTANSTDDNAYQLGTLLGGLQSHTLNKVVRTDKATLVSE